MNSENENKNMHLSDQAIGAVMMALQRSLMEQSDIVPTLKGMKLRASEQGLIVLNPPLVKAHSPGTSETEVDNTTCTITVE